MILSSSQIDDLKKGLTTETDFNSTLKERSSEYKEQVLKIKVAQAYIDEEPEKWHVLKKNKLSWKIGEEKSSDEKFEDRVWCLISKMGYGCLNKKRSWALPFGKNNGETKQIDIFAVNEETILFIECKRTDDKNKLTSLKTDLESYQKIIGGLYNAAKEMFPDRKLKHKFILATENYKLSPADRQRLNTLNGIHFSDENIDYFEKLFENIGDAAIYQFAGFVFEGNSIPEIPNRVPAIKATMGGYKYYSFSIEPSTLLKMSYVLHKNKANKGAMETYQRLVKGSRLKSIHSFIEEKNGQNFFPNSIIVNVKTDKALRFDLAAKQESDVNTQLGILHLPAKYKCVQIIDGQHRLLAYAGSEYAKKHTIPIVAFENLSSEMQIKLFMQINQNQKAVDKDLRNTLNAKILYESDLLADRIRGMRLRIAEALANDNDSWLNGFVGSGVDSAKITSTAIDTGLNMDIFLGKIKNNEILQNGVFFKGDEEKGFANFRKFIFKMVELLIQNVSEVQQPGEEGLILQNRGIHGYFRCIGDILVMLKEQGEKLDKVDEIIDMVAPYLDPLFKFFNTKIKDEDPETMEELKRIYGGGAEARYWRVFEKVIRETKPDFNPKELDDYWAKFSKQNVDNAKLIIEQLESSFRTDIVSTLQEEFGKSWFNKGIKLETQKNINNRVLDYNNQFPDNPTDIESSIELDDIVDIILQNWNLLKETYADKSIKGERREKIQWIERIAKIKKVIIQKPFIDKDNLEFLIQKKKLYLE